MKDKRILVAGGAGFIGSNLCEALLALNNKVICLDNFSTVEMDNIKHLIPNPNFKLIGGDIRNVQDCEKACNGVDYVLHQAALSSVPCSIKDPLTTNNVNVSGFLNMLTVAKNARVKRFVYAASAAANANSKGLPNAAAMIGKLVSPYAITKHVNDLYAEIFHTTYGLETLGLDCSLDALTKRKDVLSIVQLHVNSLTEGVKVAEAQEFSVDRKSVV